MNNANENIEKAAASPLLKFALEIGPLGIFFLLNSKPEIFKTLGFDVKDGTAIFYATGGFMIATIISLTLSKILLKKIPIMPLVSGVFILAFGLLTIVLNDEIFIKIKPTIVNALFATILLGGLYFNKLLLKILMGEVLRMRDEGWRILTLRWVGLFIFLAILNEFVWRNYDTNTWAAFKFFGVMPITFTFMIAQISLIMKYQIEDTPQTAPDTKVS